MHGVLLQNVFSIRTENEMVIVHELERMEEKAIVAYFEIS
jgi:hypothetical protein